MRKEKPYYFDRAWINDKPCLIIFKRTAEEVKVMPDETEEDWHKAVAELDRLNAEYRKETQQ